MEIKTLKDFGLKGKVKAYSCHKAYNWYDNEDVLTKNWSRDKEFVFRRKFNEEGVLIMDETGDDLTKYNLKERIVEKRKDEVEVFKYDENGKVIEEYKYSSVDKNDKKVMKYTYRKKENRVYVYRDAELVKIETYKENGLLVKEEVPCKGVKMYNENGKVIYEENGDVEKRYNYDNNGNLIRFEEIERFVGDISTKTFVNYYYNEKGKLMSKEEEYEDLNYKKRIKYTTEYKYDDNGNIIFEKVYTTDGLFTKNIDRVYDKVGKLIKEIESVQDDFLSEEYHKIIQYKYDEIGNMIEVSEMTEEKDGSVQPGWVTKYDYEYYE